MRTDNTGQANFYYLRINPKSSLLNCVIEINPRNKSGRILVIDGRNELIRFSYELTEENYNEFIRFIDMIKKDGESK